MAQILMPKATAVWLVDNTSLTFEQIAEFCNLHPLEVKGIADGEVAKDIRGVDPVSRGELTRDEIERAEGNAAYRLKVTAPRFTVAQPKRKGARFTPVSRRADKPKAIAWFLRYHPEITDAQISKLIGTTKNTIEQVRSRSHWDIANIKPTDPVSLGLCSQIELDEVVSKASHKRAKIEEERGARIDGPGLDPAYAPAEDKPVFGSDDDDALAARRRSELTVEDVFANFGKGRRDEDDED